MDINKLIENVKDEETRGQLVEALKPLIISSINRYCPVVEEFEDLLQDGRVIVLECIETYNSDRGHFLNYVKNYLKFYYLDTIKYLVKHQSNSDLFELDDEIEDDFSIENDIEQKELEEELYFAMSLLTQRQREVLVLYYLHNMSHSEIANLLGIKPRTVVNTKSRAIEIIRARLERSKYVNK